MVESALSSPGSHSAPPVRHIGFAVVVGTMILLLTLVGGSAVVVKNAREAALNAAALRLQNSAAVVVNAINRQLLQVDGALVSLPSVFEGVGDDQEGTISADQASRLLRALNFETFSFRDLLLIRPDGTIWAAARPRPRNLPILLKPPEDGTDPHRGVVALDGPIYNPITGDWSWYLVRPVNLRGVGWVRAAAEVPLPSIMALLAPAGAVPGMSIYIERPDGLRLASLPHDELQVGKQRVAAISRLGKDGIAFVLPAWFTTSPTIAVWRNTLYPDVQIALTLDLSMGLADWVRDRDRLLIALGVACLLVLALATALYTALLQRERVEAERRRSRELLDGAIDSMSDGFVMWDDQDRLVTCNRRFRTMYELSAPLIYPGARFEDIIRDGVRLGQYPQAGDDVDAFVRQTIEWHHSNQGVIERLLPDGRWIQITERLNPTGGIVGIRTDITVLKRTLAELADANKQASKATDEVRVQNVALTERDQELRVRNVLFAAALDNMSQGLLMVDSDRRVIVCNSRFHDIFHVDSSATAPGMTTVALFREIKDKDALSESAVESIFRQQEQLASAERSGVFVNSEDEKLALSVSQRPLPDGGWIATYEDVTERQRSESRIRFMAHHDGLTSLPNREMFRNTVAEAIDQLNDSDDSLALLYIDLDKFKFINDTLGHSAGDALLEIVARRLQGCVRDADLVARLGGDEFAVLHRARDLPAAATAQAQRVIEVLNSPYQLGQRQVDLGVSIGIAFATDSTIDGDQLLRNADMALYQAKSNYCVFEPEMEKRLHARLATEADLRVALERGQFQLYYQQLVNLRTGRLSGFEALLRWQHPTRGLVMPGQFIPLAEELGVIKQIGGWVLRQACIDARRFPDNARVSVNLSPIQLQDDEVVDTVRRALTESGLDPGRLEIEITESALLNNSARTIALLSRLHELGLSIALDDFGTGFSSLSYLRGFPFDTIKIDRLFISEMATREDCAAIVGAIVMLADRLGMATTAEGVETDEQLRLVKKLGCTSVQGYLLGRPQPVLDAIEHAMSHCTPACAEVLG